MASGVPVVSTNVGGLQEINIPGVTGYLANLGDIDEMSRDALKILKDDETLKKFKSASAEYAKKYDISNIVPHYEKLYERFL
jgi:glycosyltransferase involved in cell wall biosynthesis